MAYRNLRSNALFARPNALPKTPGPSKGGGDQSAHPNDYGHAVRSVHTKAHRVLKGIMTIDQHLRA